ncbi:MAG: glycosyltransferase, partial [Microcystis sp. M53600_WE12]|nr:glycosyltransferase [Microcystis sp. M53600_WE12]
MNAYPLVSIIIPAYNTESYIAKAIQSAQEQTLTNIEIIVIDDCSTDNTLA